MPSTPQHALIQFQLLRSQQCTYAMLHCATPCKPCLRVERPRHPLLQLADCFTTQPSDSEEYSSGNANASLDGLFSSHHDLLRCSLWPSSRQSILHWIPC